jgi:hypothetical protein
MSVRPWISEISFKDGTTISIDKDDIVIFVGPNNAGKSSALKEIHAFLRAIIPSNVIKEIKILKEGSGEELMLFLKSMKTTGGRQDGFSGYNFSIAGVDPKQQWSINFKLDWLAFVFANLLSTEKRLTSVGPAQNIALTKQPPSHPIHFLQKDESIEQTFSGYFKQAFGKDLMVHRNGGAEVPLYVGEKPLLQTGEDRLSIRFQNEIEKQEKLHEQGDGMKGFVAVLLNSFIAQHSIVFIDEPDAFLHPPQARLLGKMLVTDLPSKRQLFLATHSEDFLKGLLDAKSSKLKVIRVQRDGNTNRIALLDNAEIAQVWNDPILRYSNILSGLFHSKVILCESDSDCRFYSAILATHFEGASKISPDILFTHCGGKDRMPVVVRSLRKLDVPMQVVADFDVLNDEQPLRNIFEGLGGQWSDVESDWRLVKSSIEALKPPLNKSDLKKEIDAVFVSETTSVMSKLGVQKIQRELKKSSAWQTAKSTGKSFIPAGNPTQAFDRIQKRFKERGLLIPEVGEIEGFVRSVGNHGPKWVNEALSKDILNDKEFDEAKRFASQFID